MESFTELDEIALREYEHNKKVLGGISERISYYLSKGPCKELVPNLYGHDVDEDWFKAQCQSAYNQIGKIINSNSKLHKCYSNMLKEKDLLLLTKELICDASLLDQISVYKLGLENRIERSNFLSSYPFFLHAKFSFFTEKPIPETTHRNFEFSSMPTLIRQAIEIKIKNMIGLQSVRTKDGRVKIITISELLEFFKKNSELIWLPLPIETLESINRWTNAFIHTGVVPFCWQSLEAIDLIEPLFSFKDEKTESLSIHGFTYFKEEVTLKDIEMSLNKHFNARFTLSEKHIEGQIIKMRPS